VSLRDAHVWGAWVVIVGNGLVGAWALAANWVPTLRGRALWWSTAAAEIAIFVQVALGVAAQNVDDLEPREFHEFYGFVALFTVAIVYAYRAQVTAHRYLLYGFGGLFLMGLGIRAMLLSG
jgi:hypothetical protein